MSSLPVVDSDTKLDSSIAVDNCSSPTSRSPKEKESNIYQVPELAVCGNLFQSFPSIPLCEDESEYMVHCKKMIFSRHVVFQCQVKNTLDDQLLENVSVQFQSDDDMWDMDNI